MATANYSFNEPVVNGSTGVWGGELNANWASLDTLLKAVSDVADAALARAGGTMTGNLKALTLTYTLTDEGTGLSGAVALDLSTADFFVLSITGGVTLTFTNVPSTGSVVFVTLEITSNGAGVSWPAAVKWSNGVAPTQSGGTDIYTLYTRDGGTTWYGARVLEDAS